MSLPGKVVLVVIDGFGCTAKGEWNAVASADTPALSRLFREDGWTLVEASGPVVGLPPGQMGNSEVGHLNIGGGRVVDQDIVRISKSIDSGEIRDAPLFRNVVDRLKGNENSIHLVGLLSDGGVHSLQHHLHGLIRHLHESDICTDERKRIFVHAILDGRDTPPRSALEYVGQLLEFLDGIPCARLSTMIGRYYTMDRDKRWDRIRKGYDLMTMGMGTECTNPIGCIERCYEEGLSDEFITPITVADESGVRQGHFEDGDVVLFYDFRADRMRQIITALSDPGFDAFERVSTPDVEIVTMNQYHEDFPFPVLFPPLQISHHLGEVFAEAGLRQLRIAETEKYAHVTFFFNGGSDKKLPGEERILVPSPSVATYDQQPEMSLPELTDRAVDAIGSDRFDLIVMNIANPDMVGHTGFMDATVKAVEATDMAIARIVKAVDETGSILVVTADHGNSEIMYDETTQQPHTAHTTSPVPLIIHDAKRKVTLDRGGALANVAPTILDLLEMEKPEEMTAQSLLERVE